MCAVARLATIVIFYYNGSDSPSVVVYAAMDDGSAGPFVLGCELVGRKGWNSAESMG